MSGHTPGPWKVITSNYVFAQLLNELDNPDDLQIAKVNFARDINLITAAPDLLEALERLCLGVQGLIDMGILDSDFIAADALKQGLKAIAKAKT